MTARSRANSSPSKASVPLNRAPLPPVPSFPPATLAEWTGGHWTAGPVAAPAGFAIDTRKLRAGEMFVALRTAARDGHDFLEAAAEAGARAALVERVVPDCDLPQLVVADSVQAFQAIAHRHRLAFTGPVTGITGSAGKTSTKDLLARLLGDRVLATEGNLNNHLGVPLTLTRLDGAEHSFAVVEAGISAAGEMAPLARMIAPDVAVVTLVDHAHTRDLGGLAGVAREKALLPAAVRSSGLSFFPRKVMNHEPFQVLAGRRLVIERADVLRPKSSGSETIYYTMTQRAEETAVTIADAATDTTETYAFRRVSDGMAENAVLAISVARWLGVSPSEIRERITQWRTSGMRAEVRREGGRLVYLDCYNANPASMADALKAFQDLAGTEAPRLYVVGGMEELGGESAAKHREVGRRLRLRERDHAFIIGTEAESVAQGAVECGALDSQLETLSSLDGVAMNVARWDGAVFIKGSRRYRLETVMAGEAASTF